MVGAEAIDVVDLVSIYGGAGLPTKSSTDSDEWWVAIVWMNSGDILSGTIWPDDVNLADFSPVPREHKWTGERSLNSLTQVSSYLVFQAQSACCRVVG
jgi:hypothetical protein